LPISDRDRSRLAALVAHIKPANSLAARLATLADEQRDCYARWKAINERWFERCKARHDDEIEIEARPFAYMLQGYGPPTLRQDVHIALHGPDTQIATRASEQEAAQSYYRYMETGR
jgi:hypothetical protein